MTNNSTCSIDDLCDSDCLDSLLDTLQTKECDYTATQLIERMISSSHNNNEEPIPLPESAVIFF